MHPSKIAVQTSEDTIRRLARGGCALALAFSIATQATAADFPVTSTGNSGAGTLRQAVDDANLSMDADNTITFSLPDASTITLTTPLSNVAQNLLIDGSTATDLTIAGPSAGTAIYSVDAGIELGLTDAPFDLGDVELANDALVIFDTSIDQTVDEVIRELTTAIGKLEKRGDAELTLTGENDYSGGTTVRAGTLVVDTMSLPGNASISGGATLAFDQEAGTATFSESISGAGSLEKRGEGNLTLNGANSYTGRTRIVAGVLRGTVGSIIGDVTVEEAATLDLVVPFGPDATFTGRLSGTGTLDKTDVGLLILAPTVGNNTIANIRVLEGELRADAFALGGDVEIAASALLNIHEPSTATLDGVLSGAGDVQKQGVGELTLAGANTFTGMLEVLEGTLIGTPSSIPGDVDTSSPGVLAFDTPTATTFNNAISGDGALEKRGAGTLELAGTHPFTGPLSVFAGRLDVAGSLDTVASVDVAGGATLGGTGSVGGAVTNNGTVAPGTSIGMLTVDSISFAEGSALAVEVEPGGTSDLLMVTNTATLTGGALDLSLVSGNYTGQVFTVLNAGARIGQLSFTDDFAFVDITPAYVGGELQLTVTGNAATFASFATSPNEQQVALSLDLEAMSATADFQAVLDAFQPLSASEVPAAYNALGGEQISQLTTARLELGSRLDRSLLGRLREHGDTLRLPTAPAHDGLPAVSFRGDPADGALWLEPFGTFGAIDGRRGTSNTDYTLAGITLGGDLSPLPGVRAGAAFSYGHVELDYDSLAGSAAAHSYLGALYAGWSGTWLRAGLTSRFGYSDMETTRNIAFVGRTAQAEFNGLDVGGRLEVGAKLLRSSRYLVEPFVSVGYTHIERSQIHETGADSVNLHITREKLDSLTVGAGLRARTIFRLEDDLVLIPELHGEWTQQVGDRDRRVDSSFQDALAGSSFTVRGTELQRNAGIAGIAWTVRNERGLEVRFGYDVGFDTDRVAHSIAIVTALTW